MRVVSAGESTDSEDWLEGGTAGRAYWFRPEAGRVVVLPGFGAGMYPSEHLDFEPVVSPDEVAALERHLRSGESSE